jgi:threonylcarbamoyladenosine tRNA methylthiotransferase CDKAL1
MRFHIETYGCTSNMGNSMDAASALISLGHRPYNIEEADIIIVNTCAVTQKTENKIVKRLHQIPQDRLIISGCLSIAIPGSTEQIPCLKIMGKLDRSSALELVRSLGEEILGRPASNNSHNLIGDEKAVHDVTVPEHLCAIINIAEGCRGRCSYCIVRRARGKLVSLEPEQVVEQARSMIDSGAVELQLAAQDTAAYGLDIGSSLPELLNRIVEIPGRFMVRVGMMNPDTAKPIMNELTEALRNPKIYKFLHIPVQSGSDEVLERMCRGYTSADYIDILRLLRGKLPDLSFATDVISGFPGETEEDFDMTMRVLEQTRPDKVNITRYSRRPQTPAADFYDMPDRIKKDRSRKLTKLWLDIAGKNNRRYLGLALQVIVTERGRTGTMKARTGNYTGVVIKGASPLGSQQTVRIFSSSPYYLTGRV